MANHATNALAVVGNETGTRSAPETISSRRHVRPGIALSILGAVVLVVASAAHQFAARPASLTDADRQALDALVARILAEG